MESHGDYKIELIDNIVHVYPAGGFNEQGMKKINKEIMSIAPREIVWALLAHPDSSAGLTPEAVDELVNFFQYLSTKNCAAVGIEVASTWQGVLEKPFADKVNIPVHMNKDLEKVEQFIKAWL